jgi:uncharacterized membrane protein
MADINGNFISPLFRAAAGGGWVFRGPNPLVFGDAPHYLVNDTQRAQIETILRPRRPVVLAALLITALFAWVFAVAGLVWAFGSGQNNATTGDIIVMVVLIVIPIIAALPLTALVQGRRLQPLLKGLPRTAERITFAEINQNAKNVSTIKQSLLACISSVAACAAALAAVGMHIALKHGFLDGQTILWTFVAIAFGWAAVHWYQVILDKAGES